MRTFFTRLFLAVIVPAALGFGIACCLTPSVPEVSWYRTQDFRTDWFGDGPEIVLVVENPEDYPVVVTVACEGGSRWVVDLPAHSEVRGLAQVLNRYLTGEPCWRDSWRPAYSVDFAVSGDGGAD